ncbi:hypothetical protein CPARA_3gp362 (nucleomorph) [Cryptomonas paramecium]|uniref:Uncharacterized protein n=1 Tax=Cryptomonas paramaecium TaxID=2898 RepID=F2HI96_9CRYP|nr:hypothetical protein CPARA_3gp362 [Cryptomonas paramecium]AEA39020.1 hypothetical protein CPARA_3gp362 [Cryptomonas paramecium]|mmetsp:Transcript_35795/g.93908  ORF Transcript_35795/g.93908 Transcript_35795/m.93908 type:complete len:397 (-) Transcript_35795:4280-5470(-)
MSFFFKVLKIQGHPVKIFCENKIKLKNRFNSTQIMLKFKKNDLKYKKTLELKNSILKLVFFCICKNELRKKKYQINFYTTKKVFYKNKKNLKFFLVYEKEKMLFKKSKYVFSNNIMFQETNFISCCCFLKEENQLVTGSFKNIKIFDIFKKRYTFCIKNSSYRHFFLYPSPNVNPLILIFLKNKIEFCNFSFVLKKNQTFSINQKYSFISCSFRFNNFFVDFVDSNKSLKSFDMKNEKWTTCYNFKKDIFCIKNEKKGNLLLVNKENEVTVFDFRINREIIQLPYRKTVSACEWVQDGWSISILDQNERIFLYDLRNLKKINIKIEPKFFNSNINIHSNRIVCVRNNKKIITKNFNHRKSRILYTHTHCITELKLSLTARLVCSVDLNNKIIVSRI